MVSAPVCPWRAVGGAVSVGRMTGRNALHARFARLTFINILSNVTVPLVGLVDTAMLGHLADIRFLAGVALGTILFDYVYWSFGFLRMGTTGTTAQALGRGDRREVYLVLYRSLTMAVVIASAILVLQWPLRELGFGLLSGEAGVEAAGRDYFDARVWPAQHPETWGARSIEVGLKAQF